MLDYKRFLFEILSDRSSIEGLIIIDVQVLRELLNRDAPVERLREALDGTQLLWVTEGAWRTRLRVWPALLKSQFKLTKQELKNEVARRQSRSIHHGYWIRGFNDSSVGGLLRAEMHIVLRNPADAEDRAHLRDVAKSAIREAMARSVRRHIGPIGSERGWRARPEQVQVKIYRFDGPLRWLTRGGWADDNLVAIAERFPKLSLRTRTYFIPEPDEVWRGIRLQYEIPRAFRVSHAEVAEGPPA